MNYKTTGSGAISDGKDTNYNLDATRSLDNNTKTLIIYFSRSGNTEKQAKLAQEILHSDIFELTIDNPYSADYRKSVNRATIERESKKWPKLNSKIPNLDKYNTILLGHPIWAMTIANPMREFLEEYGSQLTNKNIASFSTNAGYGSGETQEVITKLTTASTKILDNYTVEDTMAKQDQTSFLNWLKKFE